MEVKISTRHFEPPLDSKEVLAGRLGGTVEKYFPRATDAGLTITLENHRYRVDCTVKIKGTSFHSHDEGHQFLETVDSVIKKMEIQMKKHKEKMVSSGRKNRAKEQKNGGLA